ncbi:MAG: hypothetical protein U1F43_13210 [Myxococcota bacterium]
MFLTRLAVVFAVVLGLAGEASAARSDPAEKAVGTALAAALANDFKAFVAVVHPNEKATPAQLTQLEKYTFTRVARQAKWYLRGNDADSFVVDRREDMGGDRVKLFVKDLAHPNRAPVPVTLEKVPGGAWGIISNSL